MKPSERNYVKLWQKTILLLCMGCWALSMTGCGKRYVVVPGSEPITITKQELDQVYSDNEALLKALEDCRAR